MAVLAVLAASQAVAAMQALSGTTGTTGTTYTNTGYTNTGSANTGSANTGAAGAAVGSASGGTGGIQTFTLGNGYMFSVSSVSSGDADSLASGGVQVIKAPAGTAFFVTTTTGNPPAASAGQAAGVQGQNPANMVVFGPNGYVGTGTWTGSGTVVLAGAGSSGTSGGAMQMYSFTGSPGQSFLLTRQTATGTDRALVVFQ